MDCATYADVSGANTRLAIRSDGKGIHVRLNSQTETMPNTQPATNHPKHARGKDRRREAGRIAEGDAEPGLEVSMSAGLAMATTASSLDEIVARADAALYTAKKDGRDLVRYSEESFLTASTSVRRALRARAPR